VQEVHVELHLGSRDGTHACRARRSHDDEPKLAVTHRFTVIIIDLAAAR
jgi:hypothetical protein